MRIKSVRIAGCQNPAPQVLQRGMLHDAFHQPLAETATAMPFEHEDIADIRDRREVADHAGEANLRAASIVNAEA